MFRAYPQEQVNMHLRRIAVPLDRHVHLHVRVVLFRIQSLLSWFHRNPNAISGLLDTNVLFDDLLCEANVLKVYFD